MGAWTTQTYRNKIAFQDLNSKSMSSCRHIALPLSNPHHLLHAATGQVHSEFDEQIIVKNFTKRRQEDTGERITFLCIPGSSLSGERCCPAGKM
eukprot:528819-Hanusia_phi.AAC.1